MSELLTSEDLKTERATEPPKRWRNWYRFFAIPALGLCEEVKPGQASWPTKEVAEQKALEQLAIDAPTYRKFGFNPADCEEYLGAFPDGEAP